MNTKFFGHDDSLSNQNVHKSAANVQPEFDSSVKPLLELFVKVCLFFFY